ncbi:MAG: molybdopterin-dependent oxidoreductase [Halapricum sp.]
MNRSYLSPVIVAVFAGIGAVAGSFAVAGGSQAFVVVPVEKFLTALVPGEIIAWMIQQFGDLGSQFNLLVATGLTVGAFAAIAGLAVAVGRATDVNALATLSLLLVGWGFAALLTDELLVSIGTGLGAAMVLGVSQLLGRTSGSGTEGTNPDRRRVVGGGAVAAGLGILGLGTELLSQPETTDSGVDAADDPVDAATLNGQNESRRAPDGADPTLDAEVDGQEIPIPEYKRYADEQTLDVDGIEPLLSEEFYNVDINSFDPDIDRSSWTLSVTGAVDNEFELTFEDLMEYRSVNRMVTLRCVGDSLNGHKIDNAVWTGVPLEPILERAGPVSDSCCVMLRAADDYYNEFPIDALWDGMLAFGMNGQPLPRAHGYPLRALIPGHWGEINVKWLTEIEILDEEVQGYWEKKGWHGTGPVNTVAKLWDDGIVKHDDGRVTLAGHAYAGTRGLDRVEVSTDGGDNWDTAALNDPLSPAARERQSVVDVWHQWHYEFEAEGSHEVVVRAVDGEGNVQERDRSNAYPRGATGWVSKTVTHA